MTSFLLLFHFRDSPGLCWGTSRLLRSFAGISVVAPSVSVSLPGNAVVASGTFLGPGGGRSIAGNITEQDGVGPEEDRETWQIDR